MAWWCLVAQRRVQPLRANGKRKIARQNPGVGCHDWFGSMVTRFSIPRFGVRLMVVVPSDCRVGRIKQLRRGDALHVRITEDHVAVLAVPQRILEIGKLRTSATEYSVPAR